MTHIVRPDTFTESDPVGGKARALAKLSRAGFPVPPWIALTPAAFHNSLTRAQRSALESAKRPDDVRRIAETLRLPARLRAELTDALTELSPNGERVAVRSSAMYEDDVQHSFAGQLESFLFVPPRDVARRLADVWRSAFSDRVFAYRKENRLRGMPDAPAVLVQRMVNADVSGVAFSADPVSGKRSVAVVAALFGLGTALVSGEFDADTYHVDRNGRIIFKEIAVKSKAHRMASKRRDGVEIIVFPEEEANRPALDDDQVRAIAELARKAERFFERPQDIEWAIEGGTLYLLQSRPITSLSHIADPEGTLNIWDNSNIAESYGGITTPLTFTFARNAYEQVYRQFCRVLRVPQRTIEKNQKVFANMIGMIRGRIYYNLLNWYRLLAMLPGFKVNRAFMEQMMGVKESLPQSIVEEIGRSTWRERFRDRIDFCGSVIGLVVNHFRLGGNIRGFYGRLDAALGAGRPDFSGHRSDELVETYRGLEAQLVNRWDAPLVNDFFAMIFYGLLKKLSIRWCGDSEGTLQNDLLCGEGDLVSTEPARRMRLLARRAAESPEFVELLKAASLSGILDEMARHPEFKSEYEAYIEKFGDRCADELKLESPTLHDDPLMLLRSVGQYAGRTGPPDSGAGDERPAELALRTQGEKRVSEALARRPLRRQIFHWVLRNTRARVRDRENLRFERTRVFGRVRMIFVELGRRLYALDLIRDPRDVFHLEVDELLGFVEGTNTTLDLAGLVSLRKKEFDDYSRSSAPADRFETRGIVYLDQRFESSGAHEEAGGDERKGLGCCPGVVSGPVRIVRDPRTARLEKGDILVAERTDPSWIMLFPFAAGLLVERGSLLSHSAIVARELGIPAVVSVPALTRWLADGDRVELDGTTGRVTRLESSGTDAHAQ